MNIQLQHKYFTGAAILTFAPYVADNSTAIKIADAETHEPIATPTTCLVDYGIRPEDASVIIRDYSENEGMYAALLKAGVIKEYTREYFVGPYKAKCYEAPLSDAAITAITAQYGGEALKRAL